MPEDTYCPFTGSFLPRPAGHSLFVVMQLLTTVALSEELQSGYH